MTEFLVFQLRAPLASWGEPAVGEYRGSREYPGESALIGLLGAALGVRRDDEPAQQRLRAGYAFAVGVHEAGTLMRDYHTAQVPSRTTLKGRPRVTRSDELSPSRHELNTILSTRDYRQGAACIVAMQSMPDAVYSLAALAEALLQPRFVLYLGRKACPPAAPLCPQIIAADNALAALHSYGIELASRNGVTVRRLVRLAWSERTLAGAEPDLSAPRKDRVIRRAAWQFGDRTEHIKLLAGA
ncbi:MAG TPA: type I-E CRISPR-associated protein Cas5/CasD [Candidatus Accumulibacter phosphatis]|nr:MAG: CRISPR system Cascade subunit CasD [Candidatus Accumulibacter sp. SK-11]HAY29530.1 type I-E CRISPR-associated protein Cas5/CasD [Accumulibacter sp.]HRL74351.1 type I-E CRISPR-associated protein Cas5/CasD [Candidatus Accumulibacter phosphatis]HRQ95338.1 type I-E CRISPR-associated protein Cas5/CasD [Candidatus Accumulibacter phosphatis]